MKAHVTLLLGAACLAALITPAQAAIMTEFTPIRLRAANDGSGDYGEIVEWATQDGVDVKVPKAGQKVYYGTDFFNGLLLSQLEYIEFTCRPNEGSNPYSNLVVVSPRYGNTLNATLDLPNRCQGSNVLGLDCHVVWKSGRDLEFHHLSVPGWVWSAWYWW